MTWVMFDESDRLYPAPNFCLPSIHEEKICLQDFREDSNIVLYFVQKTGCQICVEVLQSMVCRLPDYQAEEAKILAVFPDSTSVLASNQELASLPVVILSDPNQEARCLYKSLMDESLVSDQDGLLFVLDRYTAPYAALVGEGLNTAANDEFNEDILNWLEFIGIQCPE